jgi:hypothetical protein
MILDDYFKPNPRNDPLRKSSGYGWGWLLLFVFIGQVYTRLGKTSELLSFLVLFILLPGTMIIYFLLRKQSIDKNTYGNNTWKASFVAGIIAFICFLALCFISIYFIRLLSSNSSLKNEKTLSTNYSLKEEEKLNAKLISDNIFSLSKKKFEEFVNHFQVPPGWVLNDNENGKYLALKHQASNLIIYFRPSYLDETSIPNTIYLELCFPPGTYPEFTNEVMRVLRSGMEESLGNLYSISASYERNFKNDIASFQITKKAP